MFRKLRIKIVAVIISILTLLFVGILITIYFVSYQNSIEHTEDVLTKLCRSNGFEVLKRQKKGKVYYLDNYYLVQIDKNNNIQKISNNLKSEYPDKELGELALTLLDSRDFSGTAGKLFYVKVIRNKWNYVAFTNDSLQLEYFNTLIGTILIFGGIGLTLLLFVSIMLSGWLVSPIEAAFKKQKHFISDASHELKTPIAIISSNSEALSRDIGESKWLEYIRTETKRMNSLVTDLLQMATLEASEDKSVYVRLNLSETVMSSVLPFESIAFEKEVVLEEKIDNDIYVMGDCTKLGQLTTILLDNALNHTEQRGTITVSLKQLREKKILTISNTGKEIPISQQELIFERFYRLDEARTREKGSYGLGLSIAKSITLNHNGKISVSCKNHVTTFKVTL